MGWKCINELNSLKRKTFLFVDSVESMNDEMCDYLSKGNGDAFIVDTMYLPVYSANNDLSEMTR